MGPINVTLETVLNIILFYMVFLLPTIIHELGHGLLALTLTKKNERIMLGRNNKILAFQL